MVQGLKNAGLKSAAVFEQIGKELPNQSGVVEKVKAIYLYDLTKSGKSVAKVSEFFVFFSLIPQCSSRPEKWKGLRLRR